MDLLLFSLGSVGFIAALVFLIISFIRKKPKKRPLIALGICFALAVTGLFMDGENYDDEMAEEEIEEEIEEESEEIEEDDEPQEDNEEEQKKEIEAEQKEADEALKNAILQFEKEIYATEEPALLAIENYTSQANRLAEGEVSIYDVYKAASIAKEKCKQVQHAYYKIEIPKVGKEIEELLKDTKSELSTAYMLKAEAFDSAMAFLDNQKPSDLQKFEDRAVEADKFIMSAVKHLFEAKDKAGIELEEGEDN